MTGTGTSSLLQYLLDNLWALFLATTAISMLLTGIVATLRGGRQGISGKIAETPGGVMGWFIMNLIISSVMFAFVLNVMGGKDWLAFLRAILNSYADELKRRAGYRGAMFDLRDAGSYVVLWIRYL